MTPLHAGDQLDHYLLEAAIASSGMADVFRATDMRDGSPAAIKVPHPQAECDPIFHERFRREIEIGARLDHPGIRRIFPTAGSNRLYMAMEWLDGRLLRMLLAEGRVPRGRALAFARELLAALEYMHGQGVVHRDLKPENIMVDANDNIKLIDFGIAGDAGARRLTYANFTATLGTADYIAPEQVKGKRGDGRSDIYALGVILYEMLTGRLPFSGSSPMEVMNDRLLNHPLPPTVADSTISSQLQEVLYRALERDPQNRYAHAREFAHDLQHLDQIGVEDRVEIRDWNKRKSHKSRAILYYGALALIPVVILLLMVLVARHR
jgi:serine/threonine protein kinase